MPNTTDLTYDLSRRAATVLEYCDLYEVGDDSSYQEADLKVCEGATLAGAIKAYWKPLKESAYTTWKLHVQREKEMLAPIENGTRVLTGKMARYKSEREELARERRDEQQLKRIEETKVTAFELAEQGVPQEAIDAVVEQSRELVDVSPPPELRGKTLFTVSYEVSITDETLIPCDVLTPTTPAMRKALVAKVKAMAKATAGKPVLGMEIIQTSTARRRKL